MPMPSKGRRVKLTVRLPYTVFAAVASRAKARRWSISEYVSWCVEREVNPHAVRAVERGDPDLSVRSATWQARQRKKIELQVMGTEPYEVDVSGG